MVPGPLVFISYARQTASDAARQLHSALTAAGIQTFLDTRDIGTGERVPEGVVEALFASTVFAVFVDAVYFTRRYCVEELAVALAAYRALSQAGAARDLLAEAAQPIVVALPKRREHIGELERLPPDVRAVNWPVADDTAQLGDLIQARLSSIDRTIGDRLRDLGVLAEATEGLYSSIAIPQPRLHGELPVYHESGLPPSIGDAFIGREHELWELHTALASAQGGVAALTTALEGGAGFGKTRLALEYLHRYGPGAFPGGLFWINADVPNDRLELQMHGILRLIQPEVPDLRTFRESGRIAAEELREALCEVAAQKPVLYVVDNVPEPGGGAPPSELTRWCPAPGQVSLLLTSRARLSLVAEVRRLEVHELAPEAAVRLLRHRVEAWSAVPETTWCRIASWVGEWPLALELLNAALRAGAVTTAELLALLEREDPVQPLERQMAALRGVVPPGRLRGVAEALEVSYGRLPDAAQRAARLLAWMAPDPIPTRLIAEAGGALLSIEARVLLRARSFVSDVHMAGAGVEMYGRMHRVVAAFLRSRSADFEAELDELCSSLVRATDLDELANPSAWPYLNAWRPHAEAVFYSVIEQLQGMTASMDWVAVGLRVSTVLRAQGQFLLALKIELPCYGLPRLALGEEHPVTVDAMANLAVTLMDLGELDRGREMLEHVADWRRTQLGDRHEQTLRANANLATVYSRQGDLDSARQLLEQVLEGVRALLGDEHHDTLMAMSNLAVVQSGLGNLDRARELAECVLDTRRRLLDDEHPDTLVAMGNLALVLRKQGELDGARQLEEKVLECRLKLLGKEHAHTRVAIENLLVTVHKLGDEDRRRDLSELLVEATRLGWPRLGRQPST
jgi:tetratricopeptide (TPR) repeat protein